MVMQNRAFFVNLRTQIAFFVNRPGKEGSAAVIKPRKELFGYSDE